MATFKPIEATVALAARRPLTTIGVIVALALAGGLLALRLAPSTGADTFISRSTSDFRATQDQYAHFGADPVVIAVNAPLNRLLAAADLERLTSLEACLAGQYAIYSQSLQSFVPAPPGAHPPYGGWHSPCGKLMRARPAKVVYGPATFLNRAVAAVNAEIGGLVASAQESVASARQAAYRTALAGHATPAAARAKGNAAAQLATRQVAVQLVNLYLQSGIAGDPEIDNQAFISQVVFDPNRGPGQPKPQFAYLFPTADAALIEVRLKAGLSDRQQSDAIAWIREALAMPAFALPGGGSYTVTGEAVVADDLAGSVTSAIKQLSLIAVVVMAGVLLIAFRCSLRLLPLAVALAAVAITLGLMSLAHAPLTMAAIAVLPVVIGLAVDYAIQFQSRIVEIRASAASPREAISRAGRVAAPTIATAALANAVGFLVLLLSPIPMVREFGAALVVGIAVALPCAVTAGAAAIVLANRDGGALGASLRGACDLVLEARRRIAAPFASAGAAARGVGRRVAHALAAALHEILRRPVAVLVAGVLLAGAGWIADAHTPVQSDVTKLVPANLPALSNLRALERLTGVSGEIDVAIRGDDVTSVKTIRWMVGYQQALLGHFGYSQATGCARATLCPALSLPDLLAQAGPGGALPLSQATIDRLLAAVPRYFSQAVLTADHREATLSFGIRLMPLARQQQVIAYVASRLHPPPGVSARVTGLPVLAADANAALSSPARRLWSLVVGLLAVGTILLLVLRNARRVVVALIPVVLATGWSALLVFAMGIALNPMSATLGVLVIAISTEFSVLLSERLAQERASGRDFARALARTYESTGRAVLASAASAIAGFGVLALSDIRMLRDFGLVTLVDLTVSLAGVLVALPAVLALCERGDLLPRVSGVVPRRRARVG